MKLILFFVLLLSISSQAKEPLAGAQLNQPLPANLWIEMSRLLQPGVVGVYLDIDIRKTRIQRDPMFELLEELLGGSFHYKDPRGQQQEESTPIGTGFLIDQQGHIVTNYHVIEAVDDSRLKTKLQVQIKGQEQLLDVKVLGRDKRGDLALIKLIKPPKNLTPLQFGDSDQLQVGEYVAAFGNPYGHSNSMTVGIVSAKGRAIKEINRFPFIQTDASINPGNSGGPLLNSKGYVIGVNTAIDARAQGIGFAIPSNYVTKIISNLKSGKKIRRGFLGIGMAPIHPRVALSYGVNGIMVRKVEPGFPADKAGLKVGDIITSLNNKALQDVESFVNSIQDSTAGEKITLAILRPTETEFKEMTFTVTLTDYPDAEPSTSTPTKKLSKKYKGKAMPYALGFSLVNSSSGARREFDIPIRFPFGPIISSVTPSSPASQGGFKAGFVILKVNGNGVNSIQDVLRHLRPGVNRFWVHTPRGEKKISLKSE